MQKPPPWDAAWVALRYEMPIDHLIHRFKYAGDRCAGKLCGRLLVDALPAGAQGDVLAVPMHRKRLAQRGFNHAASLARDVARARNLQCRTGAMRVRDTVSQVGLDAPARRRNLRDAFTVPTVPEAGRHAILVDDIYTTGATLAALSRACKRAGYGSVTVLCLARVPGAGRAV
ncbi:MAG: ComF family protein [Pseudomonadota bacterium]